LQPAYASCKILPAIDKIDLVIESRKEAGKSLDISDVTIEFYSDTQQHLKILENQLNHIHDVDVYLVEPKDPEAPALVAIGITKGGERAALAAHNIAQVLYDFIHGPTSPQGEKKILLFTIEGGRTDIEPLTTEEIEGIIVTAKKEEDI
jgi:hypothetical protein